MVRMSSFNTRGKAVKASILVHLLRLLLTRIRFRLSDFGQVTKLNIIRATLFCAEMVLGSFVFLLE